MRQAAVRRGVATWLMERLCEMLQASFDATAMADTGQLPAPASVSVGLPQGSSA